MRYGLQRQILNIIAEIWSKSAPNNPFGSFSTLHFFFPLIFVVLRVPFLVPFSFVLVLSSHRFPFDSCIAFFALTFASLLSLVADSIILLFRLGATCPPRSLRAWSMRIPLACCLLALLMLTFFFFFLSSFLFRFRFGHRLFSCRLFLVGTMLSPRFRFLLRLV